MLTWQYRFYLSNNAVSAILAFIKILISILNKIVQSQHLDHVLGVIPTTVFMCQKLLKANEELFMKFSLCVKCSEIYYVMRIAHAH